MRLVLVLLAVSGLFAAVPENVVTPEPNARFRALVAEADRFLVHSAGLHSRDLKNQKLLLDVQGVADVARIAGLFRFTGQYASVSVLKINGEWVMFSSNCLCTGTHMISFVRDGTEVLAMTLHHWEHVRPSRGWKCQDISLTKESADGVRAFLLSSIPSEKKANQSPEPTPGSVTPRATVPK